jgi:hydrogenase-4 membrane subunit HyfE
LGAGMLIPSFFLFTIFIRRRKIKPQVIKFCGIVSLLMLFECLTLILHPYVVEISHHIVIIELLIFVGIAAIVIPTHHKIEHWLLSKLTEHKNAAHHK